MINLFKSPSVLMWGKTFAANFIIQALDNKNIAQKLTPLPGSMDPAIFYTTFYKLDTVASKALNTTTDQYFSEFIKLKASKIQVTVLIFNLNYTLYNIFSSSPELRNLKIDAVSLIEEILSELLADATLQKYFGWFLFPISKYRYVRVLKYLKQLIFKIIMRVILRSVTLSQHDAYSIYNTILGDIPKHFIDGCLWESYRRIAGTLITYLALPYLAQTALNCDQKEDIGNVYLKLVLYLFKVTMLIEATAPMNAETDQSIINFFSKINDFLTNFLKGSGVSCVLQPLTSEFSILPFVKQFISINLKRARFAEFNGDNKKVCATVYKHNLVREAVFDEKRFRYCVQLAYDFRAESASKDLGSLDDIRDQMNQLMELKKSFYCSACHSKDSMNIVLSEGTVIISEEFCYDFITKFKPYLDWKYTKFHEFQSKIFQYLSCFGKPGNLTDTYPYESYDSLLPKNFTDWTRCSNVNSIQNISNCFSICSQIKLNTYSEIIDGDRKNLKRLYNYGVNVLRQYGLQFGKFDQKNIEEFNKQLAQDLEPSTDTTDQVKETPKEKEIENDEDEDEDEENQEKNQQRKNDRRLFSGRVLKEVKRPVIYNLRDDDYNSDRFLQSTTPGTSSPPIANATNSTNSTNSTAKKNSTLKIKSITADKEILMKIKLTINSNLTLTRTDLTQISEIDNPQKNYLPENTVSSIKSLKTIVEKSGLNPLKKIKNMNFDSSMIKTMIYGEESTTSENIDKGVIKDCIAASKKDAKDFNKDFGISFKMPKRTASQSLIKEADERLFQRYKDGMDNQWETYKLAESSKRKKKKKDKKNKKPKMRNLSKKTFQKVKDTRDENFLSNLFLKVLY